MKQDNKRRAAQINMAIPHDLYSRIVRLAAALTLQDGTYYTPARIVRAVLDDYFAKNPRQINLTENGEEIR